MTKRSKEYSSIVSPADSLSILLRALAIKPCTIIAFPVKTVEMALKNGFAVVVPENFYLDSYLDSYLKITVAGVVELFPKVNKKCPNCLKMAPLKKYVVLDREGFVCPSCKAELKLEQKTLNEETK